MYVENYMSKEVVCISGEESIQEAMKLMLEGKYSQLPVVTNDKLDGLVTEKLLKEVSPSKATSLSMYELNYLLAKTKVRDIMLNDVFITTPRSTIGEAAMIMRNEDINSLPVVDENNAVVGIITKNDVLDSFIEIIGLKDNGTRLVLDVKDKIGAFAEISNIIKEHNINIMHVSNFNSISAVDHSELVIRVDSLEVDELINELNEKGYKVISSVKNEA